MLCSCSDPACGAVGKHPLTPHGLKDATSDLGRLSQWWQRWPQANIGLVLPYGSSCVVRGWLVGADPARRWGR
jgi:hypothetical protein